MWFLSLVDIGRTKIPFPHFMSAKTKYTHFLFVKRYLKTYAESISHWKRRHMKHDVYDGHDINCCPIVVLFRPSNQSTPSRHMT